MPFWGSSCPAHQLNVGGLQGSILDSKSSHFHSNSMLMSPQAASPGRACSWAPGRYPTIYVPFPLSHLHLKFNIPQIQPISLPPIPHHLACFLSCISYLSKWENKPTKALLSKNSHCSLILALRQLKAKLCGADITPAHFQPTKPGRFCFSLIPFCSHQCARPASVSFLLLSGSLLHLLLVSMPTSFKPLKEFAILQVKPLTPPGVHSRALYQLATVYLFSPLTWHHSSLPNTHLIH